MMQDRTTTVAVSTSTNQHSNFDSGVNGHDYLLSIIQLPIYLQVNLSRAKQLKTNTDGPLKRRLTVSKENFCQTLSLQKSIFFSQTLGNGTSTFDISAKPITTKKLSKNKRRRQRRDTLPNTKPV